MSAARIWQDPTHMPIGHGELCPCCQVGRLAWAGGTRFECEGCSGYDLLQGPKAWVRPRLPPTERERFHGIVRAILNFDSITTGLTVKAWERRGYERAALLAKAEQTRRITERLWLFLDEMADRRRVAR